MKKTKDTQYLFLSANIRALQTKMVDFTGAAEDDLCCQP